MKVKIIQAFTTAKGELQVGQVLEVKPAVAEKWIAEGLARKTRLK